MAQFHAGLKVKKARLFQRPAVYQIDMARGSGIPRSTISHAESGRLQPSKALVRYCSLAWGIPEEWFWNGLDDEVPRKTGRLAESVPLDGEDCIPYLGVIPGAPVEGEEARVPYFLAGATRQAARAGAQLRPRFDGELLIFEIDAAPRPARIALVKSPTGLSIHAVARLAAGGYELRQIGSEQLPKDWEIVGFLLAALKDYSRGRGLLEWDTGGVGA